MGIVATGSMMRSAAFAGVTLAAMIVSASADNVAKPLDIPEIHPGILQGYLPQQMLPNSLELLPPPPSFGSSAFALDQAVSRSSFALRDTPRWVLATKDADLSFPNAAGTFSCALDAPVSEQETPVLYRLLRRSLTDAGLATYSAKDKYKRTRPFVANGEPVCTPAERDFLAKDGSYPSGHTSIGWAWALILAEVAPERSEQIFARGRSFGESRLVCNVHWNSDVVEGRMVAAMTVARLHSEPSFLMEVATARDELTKAHEKNLAPTRDCASEAAALSATPPNGL